MPSHGLPAGRRRRPALAPGRCPRHDGATGPPPPAADTLVRGAGPATSAAGAPGAGPVTAGATALAGWVAGPARTLALARAAAVTAAAVLLLSGVGVLAAVPAWAHAQLVAMTPADGSTVAVAPAQVVLLFDENIQPIGDAVVVTGPDGSRVDTGPVLVHDATATQRLRPLVDRGRYTVSYRVVSDDGHPVTRTLTFVLSTGLAVASSPAAAPAAEAAGAGGGHWWVGAAALAAALLAAVGLLRARAVRRQRRRRWRS